MANRNAREIMRNMFKLNQPKQIDYLKYSELELTAELTLFSKNVLTYIVQSNDEDVAQKKANEFINCNNCDLSVWIK